MKKNLKWILIALALLLTVTIFVACSKADTQNRNVERWEYDTVVINLHYSNFNPLPMDRLNELGLEGWELVSTNLNWNSGIHYFYFKRRLP